MSPYPTIAEIHSLFANLSNGQGPLFFSRVVENVDWIIRGHSPMSGQYTSKADFQAKTLGLLNEKVLTAPLKMYVDNVVGGGEQDQAVVEMHADSVCRNGECTVFLAGKGKSGRMEGC
jgi:uncharacterized protein